MNEHEPEDHSSEIDHSTHDHIVLRPLGATEEEFIFEAGSTKQDPDEAVKHIQDFATASGAEIITPEQAQSHSFFALSSKSWNSPWNPAGPKKNWVTPPPADPTAN